VVKSALVPRDIVETSRASILILGPLLARNGYAKVSKPGGCPIGDRKFNYHLDGLKLMGAKISVDDRHIVARADKLCGIDFRFPAKTVTGTENLLLAAVLAQGVTVLDNCAAEPEVFDLIQMLKKMGASIRIEDDDRLIVEGQTSLSGARHRVIPDRIEMGTYIIAGGFLGNELIIENAVPQYIECLLQILKSIGVDVTVEEDRIKVCSNGDLSAVEVETSPFPGFPTDLQAQLTTLLTQARGVSRIKENIFNNRFQHVNELNRLGADIEVRHNVAIIRGKTPLKGQVISATDLRASAALVLGGVIAEGDTIIENAHQLFRGYETMPEKLEKLGARLEVVREHPKSRS
jgi:UDP-N-acetylglucosamine 1-carboxyvinyltransferase